MREVKQFKLGEFLKDFQTLIPVVSIVISILGFMYMKSYYNAFSIDIEYYVSLNDLIFLPLTILIKVFIASIIFLAVFNVLFSFCYSYIEVLLLKLGAKQASFDKNDIETLILAILLVLGFFSYFLVKKYDLTWLLYVLPVTMAKMKHILDTVSDGKSNYKVVSIVFISLVASVFVFVGMNSAKSIIATPSKLNIQFVSNKQFYSTKSGCYFFIGETSNHMFLYDLEDKSSLVFQKSEIMDLRMQKISK